MIPTFTISVLLYGIKLSTPGDGDGMLAWMVGGMLKQNTVNKKKTGARIGPTFHLVGC